MGLATPEMYIYEELSSSQNAEIVTSQTTPMRTPKLPSRPPSPQKEKELTPVSKTLRDALPLVFLGNDEKGNKVKSRRRINAVHLTSDAEMQARNEAKVEKGRKEKEKR